MKRLALLLLVLCVDCKRVVPAGKVVLVPIGSVSANVLADLQRELAPILQREVTIGNEIALPAFDQARPENQPDAE